MNGTANASFRLETDEPAVMLNVERPLLSKLIDRLGAELTCCGWLKTARSSHLRDFLKAAIQYAKILPLTMQLLSSSSTYFYKFILPVLLAVVACVIYFRVQIEDRYNAPLVLFASGVILFFEYWFFGRAKKISLDGTNLVISNFRQEVRVPLSNLEKASGSLGMRPDVVWLYFRQTTPFGKKILFVPTERAFPGFNQHPIVAMLNAKARTHQ